MWFSHRGGSRRKMGILYVLIPLSQVMWFSHSSCFGCPLASERLNPFESGHVVFTMVREDVEVLPKLSLNPFESGHVVFT